MGNLSDHLFRNARDRGEKIALVFGDTQFSYGDLAAWVRSIAGGLAQAGIGIGTRVGLLIDSRPEFIAFQQALFAVGAVVSPLNIFYTKTELAAVIGGGDLDFLIAAPRFAGVLPEPGATCLKAAYVIDLAPDQENDTLRSADRLAKAGHAIAQPVALPPEALGLLLNTSATTGKAKCVMLSLANIKANYDPTSGWLGLTPDSVILCALPLYNTFGLNQCINAALYQGATLVLMPKFDAAACLAAIARWRCSFFPAVPTMLQKLIDHPEAGRHDLSSISRIMTGAAPVPAALLERIYRVMGQDTVVMTGYGMTEGSALVSLDHIELDDAGRVKRPKSIGKVLPGMEMKILSDSGAAAAAGEVGEICVRGPNVMLGYYKMPEVTAATIVDGWLHTGDLGCYEADGFFYIVDRKKDLIIRGGQNIYPSEIEEILYQFPGIREVAVIGQPDEMLGEVPIAYVAHDPETAFSLDDLFGYCRERLSYFKVPASIIVLPELPKGPTGKILRRELRPQQT